MKKALITGAAGQDGSYLAELLLEKGYHVYGMVRPTSVSRKCRFKNLETAMQNPRFHVVLSDLCDSGSIVRVLRQIQPDEIYNLAAQSHVGSSFMQAEQTANINALGALRLLESVRELGLLETTRFYQASTSELYGNGPESPQTESTPFSPRSPYGVSKLYAYWATVNFREAYNMYACNGILFNHESPRRGEAFVTRKITQGLANIKLNKLGWIELGNLDALRDWGHAKDYVRMQWMMLQCDQPKDYVIASGKQYSVRNFVEKVCAFYDWSIEWRGSGLEEQGWLVDQPGFDNRPIVKINPTLFRPSEVDNLLGDPSRACRDLGWLPEYQFEDLVFEMAESDFRASVENS